MSKWKNCLEVLWCQFETLLFGFECALVVCLCLVCTDAMCLVCTICEVLLCLALHWECLLWVVQLACNLSAATHPDRLFNEKN